MSVKTKKIVSYAYNNKILLEPLTITTSFVINPLTSFQLCGIVKKLDYTKEVILLNEHGFLEGCTKIIG